MHPSGGAFFRDYLSRREGGPLRDRFVINTHFPPFPAVPSTTLPSTSAPSGSVTTADSIRHLRCHQPLRVRVLGTVITPAGSSGT
jgi:hypothetical protein